MMDRDPIGGLLAIYGEGTSLGSTFCYATRARQSLHHGCMGYLADVVDTRDDEKKSIAIYDVPVVRDFLNVFTEELAGVPPKRQVEFRSNLIPGTTPISMAPYCLVPLRYKSYPLSFRSCLERRLFDRVVSCGVHRSFFSRRRIHTACVLLTGKWTS